LFKICSAANPLWEQTSAPAISFADFQFRFRVFALNPVHAEGAAYFVMHVGHGSFEFRVQNFSGSKLRKTGRFSGGCNQNIFLSSNYQNSKNNEVMNQKPAFLLSFFFATVVVTFAIFQAEGSSGQLKTYNLLDSSTKHRIERAAV